MKTILILEDEPYLLKAVTLYLQRGGYRIAQSESPATAVQQFQDHGSAVDLLIADLTLPVGSGVEVATHLKGLSFGLKVIVMSGYALVAWNENDADLFTKLPSDSVRILQKPFSPASLLLTVDELIGSGDSLTAVQSR